MTKSLLHHPQRSVTQGVLSIANKHISGWVGSGAWHAGRNSSRFFPSKKEIIDWMIQFNSDEEIDKIVTMPVFSDFPEYRYSVLNPTEIKRFISLALWGGSELLEVAGKQRIGEDGTLTRYALSFYSDEEDLAFWKKLFSSNWRKDQPLDAREISLLRYLVRKQGLPDLTVGNIAFMRLRADDILDIMTSARNHNASYIGCPGFTHSSVYIRAVGSVTDKWSARLWANTFFLYNKYDFYNESASAESIAMLTEVAAKNDINTSLKPFIYYLRAGVTNPKAIVNGLAHDIDSALLLNF